eukprot:748504-Hanusia_phi.AAC.3
MAVSQESFSCMGRSPAIRCSRRHAGNRHRYRAHSLYVGISFFDRFLTLHFIVRRPGGPPREGRARVTVTRSDSVWASEPRSWPGPG